ncbi:MAG: very short patch repair endonuclease [bacterium]
MADVVTPQVRSRMMAGIRGKNTRPEVSVRLAVFERGLRYRIHDAKLPGKPDLVFAKHRAAVFIHGCFWHGHQCVLFKWPKTNAVFWRKKILGNRRTDRRARAALDRLGWRSLVVWECALKGPSRRPLSDVVDGTVNWVACGRRNAEIAPAPRSR